VIKKLLFLVDKLPYKAENSRLALTHAIASQTVEIHLEDEDNVEPVLAFVGEGVLNCIKGQKSLDAYGITSLEGHIKNALLLDLKVMVCKEDLKKFGLTEDSIIMDAEDIGGDMLTNVLPFADILNEMEVADHILHF
jgi:sulfur relay (sulfurtransferase) DsrF/TusC family protein